MEDIIRKIINIKSDIESDQIELAQLKRKMTQILNLQLQNFINDSTYFDGGEGQDEDEIYELNQTFASYLRCFALLDKKDEVYRELQVSVCIPIIDKCLKQTLNARQIGDKVEQPIQVFFEGIRDLIVNGSMKNLFSITVKTMRDELSEDHAVEDYDFFNRCVWSYVYKNLIQSGPLNFFTSTSDEFIGNYKTFQKHKKWLVNMINLDIQETKSQMENLFNIEAYMSLQQYEYTQTFQKNLQRLWNCTNDQL